MRVSGWTLVAAVAASGMLAAAGSSARGESAADQLRALSPTAGKSFSAPAVPAAAVAAGTAEDPSAELSRLGDAINAVYRKAEDSLVVVWVANASQHSLDEYMPGAKSAAPPTRMLGLGSGLVVGADGLILTNRHVADGVKEGKGNFLLVNLPDRRMVEVKSVQISEEFDAALLRVDAKTPLRAATLGDSASLKVGDSVFALGSPLGLRGTFTWGTVTRFNPDGNLGIQSNVVVNPGNSGGPMFDVRGNVVGLNTAISPGPYYSGNSFAVPIDKLKDFIAGARNSSGGTSSGQPMTDRFLPENRLRVPIGALEAGGITRAQYDEVLDRIQSAYGPVVEARGGRLTIDRLWDDPTVNAQAVRQGNDYILKMFGGLPRYKSMTEDGYFLVVCHELGHHLGGFPREAFSGWASNEGEADYFANLKCMRRVLGGTSAADAPAEDPVARRDCAASFPDAAPQDLCVRTTMAGLSMASLFIAAQPGAPRPALGTPDRSAVLRTSDEHPAPQCRVDTFFQAALCAKPVSEDLSDSSPVPGACTQSQGFGVGLRPRCWYRAPKGEEFVDGAARSSARVVGVSVTPVSSAPSETPSLHSLRAVSPWTGL